MTTSLPLNIRLVDPGQCNRPLQDQLYRALSQRILDGRLQPGDRLPSSRQLAADLTVARNTVLAVYDQLQAEGFIRHQERSGTFVDPRLPASGNNGAPRPAQHPRPKPPKPALPWLQPKASTELSEQNRPFTPGLPDLSVFPLASWNRLLHQQESRPGLLGYDSHQGYAPLRRAIADYLRQSRGVYCQPDQVIVTQGAQQGLSMIAELFLQAGDRVLIEDPGYRGARYALARPGPG